MNDKKYFGIQHLKFGTSLEGLDLFELLVAPILEGVLMVPRTLPWYWLYGYEYIWCDHKQIKKNKNTIVNPPEFLGIPLNLAFLMMCSKIQLGRY